MSTISFGEWLQEKRDRASLGLRKFALLIGDSPSNVCNIENGERAPWRNEPKLRKVAEVLGIKENSDDWDMLFRLARRPDQPPADLISYTHMEMIPTLLRTIGEYQLNEDEIRQVLQYVKRKFRDRRSDVHAKHRR